MRKSLFEKKKQCLNFNLEVRKFESHENDEKKTGEKNEIRICLTFSEGEGDVRGWRPNQNVEKQTGHL